MKGSFTKILAAIAYIVMITVNFLANSLLINNQTTGGVSDAYPNLFTPAGLTFSIWGLIYLLLAGYVAYQFIKSSQAKEMLFQKINPLFIGTSVANISWIFTWHYDFIGVSMLLMFILLFFLIKIADIIRMEEYTSSEKYFIQAPFSVYFGWISVATIANITVFLVSIGWNGFGIADFVWTNVILLVGAFIGILRMCKDKNIIYGLVLVWAYFGILFKHLSSSGFDGKYTSIIATATVCLVLFAIFIGKLAFMPKVSYNGFK